MKTLSITPRFLADWGSLLQEESWGKGVQFKILGPDIINTSVLWLPGFSLLWVVHDLTSWMTYKNIKRRRRKMRFIPTLVSMVYWLWNTKCCANARIFFTSPRLHFWLSCNANKKNTLSWAVDKSSLKRNTKVFQDTGFMDKIHLHHCTRSQNTFWTLLNYSLNPIHIIKHTDKNRNKHQEDETEIASHPIK